MSKRFKHIFFLNILLVAFIVLFKSTFVFLLSSNKETNSTFSCKSFHQAQFLSPSEIIFEESDDDEKDKFLSIDLSCFGNQNPQTHEFLVTDSFNKCSEKNLFLLFSAPPLYILFQQQKSFLS